MHYILINGGKRAAPWGGNLFNMQYPVTSWRTSKTEFAVLIIVTLAIILASVMIRYRTYNSSIIGSDAAQYLGAARDYILTGEFTESLTSKSFPRFLPLGLPAMVVAVVKLTGWGVQKSGVFVALFFGSLIPGIVFLMAFRGTKSFVYSILGALLIVFNWRLISLSTQCMTDNLYVFFFLILSWILAEYFARRTDTLFIVLCALIGILFGILYEIRYPSIFLLVGIPVALGIRNARIGYIGWRKFALGALLFSLIGWTVVLTTSYRFYKANGFFTLIPAASMALAFGEVKAIGNLDLLKLNEKGTASKWIESEGQARGIAGELASHPAKRLYLTVINAKSNFLVLWNEIWTSDQRVQIAAFCMFLLPLICLVKRIVFQGRKCGMLPPIPPTCFPMTYSVGILSAMHFATYSLVNVNPRYMVQLAPPLAVIIPIFLARLAPLNNNNLVGLTYRQVFDAAKYIFAKVFDAVKCLINRPSLCAEIVAIVSVVVVLFLMRSVWPASRSWRLAQPSLFLDAAEISTIAASNGIQPVVMTQYTELPFRLYAQEVDIPFGEEDPELLFRLIRGQGVNFSRCDSSITFRDTENGFIISVPVYHLLLELATSFPDSIRQSQAGRVFFIKDPPLIKLLSKTEHSEKLERVQLEPDKIYLILNEWRRVGEIPKDVLQKTSMVLSDGSYSRGLLKAKPFPEILRQTYPSKSLDLYYQYVVFSTNDIPNPRLSLTTVAGASNNSLKYDGGRIFTIEFSNNSQNTERAKSSPPD